jgi:hypothetical protein
VVASVVVLLGALAGLFTARHSPVPPASGPVVDPIAGPVAPVDVPVGGHDEFGAFAPRDVPISSAPPADTVRYSFDGGAADPSSGGHPRLALLSENGGVIGTVGHGDGRALRFPPRCGEPEGASCPRAILQSLGDTDRINPRATPFSYGASVRLPADQTSDGENVLQKGFATAGSEFKLQIDGAAGQPSCAVVGTSSDVIFLAQSSVSVADGAWHTISCAVAGSRLTILVDGHERGHRDIPAGLSIHNDEPLRLGGKGKSANNDQFNGALDDVWVRIG